MTHSLLYPDHHVTRVVDKLNMTVFTCATLKLTHKLKTVFLRTMLASASWDSLFSQMTQFPHFCNVRKY